MYIFELTICYESRFNLAHDLKMEKYTELFEEARKSQYTCTSNLITLEVGSRGPFHLTGFKALQPFIKMPSKEWNALLVQMTRRVITESHRVWVMKN